MLSTGHLGGGRESQQQQQQQQRRRPAARVSLGPDSRGAAGPILGGGDCGVVVGRGGGSPEWGAAAGAWESGGVVGAAGKRRRWSLDRRMGFSSWNKFTLGPFPYLSGLLTICH